MLVAVVVSIYIKKKLKNDLTEYILIQIRFYIEFSDKEQRIFIALVT